MAAMFDPYVVRHPLILSVRLSDEDMAQIAQLLRKLDDAETLNAELLAALEVALPVVEEAEDDMDTQGEWADEPIAPQIRAAITKARGG